MTNKKFCSFPFDSMLSEFRFYAISIAVIVSDSLFEGFLLPPSGYISFLCSTTGFSHSVAKSSLLASEGMM